MAGERKNITCIRKKEICQAALECFIEKGFHKTGMEDVIRRSKLSKGGVYYYYKSTKEMIFDILIEGNNYRIGIIKDYIEKNKLGAADLKNPDIVADLIVEKILTKNRLMKVYAQLLLELKYDQDLYDTYIKIVEKSKLDLGKIFFEQYRDSKDDELFLLLTDIINSFIVGANILDLRENFEKNRDVLKEMIKVVLMSKWS